MANNLKNVEIMFNWKSNVRLPNILYSLYDVYDLYFVKPGFYFSCDIFIIPHRVIHVILFCFHQSMIYFSICCYF